MGGEADEEGRAGWGGGIREARPRTGRVSLHLPWELPAPTGCLASLHYPGTQGTLGALGIILGRIPAPLSRPC